MDHTLGQWHSNTRIAQGAPNRKIEVRRELVRAIINAFTPEFDRKIDPAFTKFAKL